MNKKVMESHVVYTHTHTNWIFFSISPVKDLLICSVFSSMKLIFLRWLSIMDIFILCLAVRAERGGCQGWWNEIYLFLNEIDMSSIVPRFRPNCDIVVKNRQSIGSFVHPSRLNSSVGRERGWGGGAEGIKKRGGLIYFISLDEKCLSSS